MGFSFFRSKKREQKKADSAPNAAALRERSSNPQVSIKLAEHFLRENKRDLAVDEYLNAAQAFLDKRQSQLAMAVYRNIITIAPERYGVYETLADLYLMSGFPGDGASVLLALAYQYKTAGRDSEVKRVLDSVLEVAPDNPVLKRKVEAFFAAEGMPGAPASAKEPAGAPAAPKSAEPEKQACAPEAQLPGSGTGPTVPKAAFVEQKTAAPVNEPARAHGTSPAEPEPAAPEPRLFDAGAGPEALKVDAAEHKSETTVPGQDISAAQKHASVPEPAQAAQSPSGEERAGNLEAPATSDEESFFDLRSALAEDEPDEESRSFDTDAAARSFFDLQSALADDASLRFDHEPEDDELLAGGQESSLFSVLNVVRDIALQDPKQDTPQFHFNLGVAYMKCADYEQAVDELLSALYGIADKVGCYVRLAECSLKLQRRELACGFLREALDCPDIGPEQARAVRKRLDEIAAAQ